MIQLSLLTLIIAFVLASGGLEPCSIANADSICVPISKDDALEVVLQGQEQGRGLLWAENGKTESFRISLTLLTPSSSLHTSAISSDFQRVKMRDAVVHARIISSHLMSSVSLSSPVEGEDWYRASYSLLSNNANELDANCKDCALKLQLRVSWLAGATLDDMLPLQRGPESAFNFSKRSMYLNKIIYNKPLELRVTKSTSESHTLTSSRSKYCKSAWDSTESGRWSRKSVTGESSLFDKFHFNQGYTWEPTRCQLKIFSAVDIAKCFKEKNIRKVAFTGDSLIREHYQNILSIIASGLGESNGEGGQLFLQKLKKTNLITLDLSPLVLRAHSNSSFQNTTADGFSVDFHYFLIPKEWGGNLNQLDAHLWGINLLKLLTGSNDSKSIAFWAANLFNNTLPKILRHRKDGSIHTYFIPPKIQFEDPRVLRDDLLRFVAANATEKLAGGVSGFAGMTPTRYAAATNAVKNILDSGRVGDIGSNSGSSSVYDYLDGSIVSDSRWESTWDGIHYSLLTNSEKYYSKETPSKCENRMRSGNQLCGPQVDSYLPKVLAIPGISECENGELYYCTGSKGSHLFDMFEGGVSKMMTMAWINKICN